MRSWSRGAPRDAAARANPATLPAPEQSWWHVMGYEAGPPRSLAQVEQRFRHLAARAHPDRGGSAELMQRLIRARIQARRQLTP
jgi:hypothetical protein